MKKKRRATNKRIGSDQTLTNFDLQLWFHTISTTILILHLLVIRVVYASTIASDTGWRGGKRLKVKTRSVEGLKQVKKEVESGRWRNSWAREKGPPTKTLTQKCFLFWRSVQTHRSSKFTQTSSNGIHCQYLFCVKNFRHWSHCIKFVLYDHSRWDNNLTFWVLDPFQ